MKMNVYQEISQIIKEADGILIGASNGLSIAEGYNIFADDAWFQENMGDFREKYGLRCVLHGFSVPMKVEEKWAFVSRLVKAKAISYPLQIIFLMDLLWIGWCRIESIMPDIRWKKPSAERNTS